MSTQPLPALNPAFDSKLANAACTTFRALYAESDAEADRSNFVNKIAIEKGPNAEKAFSVLIGCCKSGLVAGENLILAISKITSTDKTKVPALIHAWVENEPTEKDAVIVMDAIHVDYPQLLGVIIEGKKSWKKADIRKQLSKYPYSEELWFKLESIEEDLKGRK